MTAFRVCVVLCVLTLSLAGCGGARDGVRSVPADSAPPAGEGHLDSLGL